MAGVDDKQTLGEVKPPDPYAKFKQPDSAKWASATKREYSQLVNDAAADGRATGKDKVCENNGDVRKTEACGCRECSAASAAHKKQVELTGYDISVDAAKKGF